MKDIKQEYRINIKLYKGNNITLGERTNCDLRGNNQKGDYVCLGDCQIHVGNQKAFARTNFTEAITTSSLAVDKTGELYVGDRLRVYAPEEVKVVGTVRILEKLK